MRTAASLTSLLKTLVIKEQRMYLSGECFEECSKSGHSLGSRKDQKKKTTLRENPLKQIPFETFQSRMKNKKSDAVIQLVEIYIYIRTEFLKM